MKLIYCTRIHHYAWRYTTFNWYLGCHRVPPRPGPRGERAGG